MVRRPRLPLVVLVLTAALGLVTGVAAVVVADRPEPLGEVALPAPADEPEGVRVLRAWDAQRAQAYARADGAALALLYAAGSRTGAADVSVLRGYRSRGLRVTGLRTQVLAARVLRESEHRIVVLVTDLLAGGVADDGHGGRWPLPHDRPSTRRVVLVGSQADWRVAEAYAVE